MLGLLTIIGLACFIYIYLIKPLQYWKHRQVPQYSVAKICKNLLASFIPTQSMPDSIKQVYNDFPDQRYLGVYQFAYPGLLLRDPDLIKQITIKDFEHFTDHFTFMTEKTEPIWSKNLVSLKGEKWKNMRIILSPAFTSRKLKTIYPLIINCAKQLTDHFEKYSETTIAVDISKIFQRFTCDVIATSAFGFACNSFEDPDNEFFQMGTNIFKNTKATHLKFIIKIFFPRLANLLHLKIINDRVTKFFEKLVIDNIKARETQGIIRQDMIQLLLEAKRKREVIEEGVDEDENEIYKVIKKNENEMKKIRLTNEDILSQAFVFFFAGFEAVSVVMSFLAYELALNPEVQEKLYREIKENIRQFGPDPTYENLMKMKYLDMVISENLRMSPVAPQADRVCTKPYTIQPKNKNEHPVHLSVGQHIFMSPYSMHCDPIYFSNPERFDPERFSDKNKHKILSGTYFPFGIGPRHCIANRFALMEMKVNFFYILAKFKIVVVDKTPIPRRLVKSQVSVKLEGGFWVGLQKRTD